MDLKLPYGLKGDRLVHIDDLNKNENGLACKCICPNCHERLIARMGEVRVNHFAHYHSNCAHSIESTLHILAKEILEESLQLRVPSLVAFYEDKKFHLFNEKILKFDQVILEEKQGDVIPDLICYIDGEKLYVEIAVTHFIDEEKYEKIKEKSISTLEIDLSSLWELSSNKEFTQYTKRSYIKELIINSIDNKEWIFHAMRKKFIDQQVLNKINKINKMINKKKFIYEYIVKVLYKKKSILLPKVILSNNKILYESMQFNYERIKLISKKENSIQLKVIKNGNLLYIELYLGSISDYQNDEQIKFSVEKYQEYSKVKQSAIMIDLYSLIIDKGFTIEHGCKEKLNKIIFNENQFKTWLYNHKEIIKEEKIKLENEKRNRKLKKVKMKNISKSISMARQHKKQWGSEFENSKDYAYYKKILNIDGDYPNYLNQKIKGSIVFECDPRKWQSFLFYTYIHKWRSQNDRSSKKFQVKHVISFLKKSYNIKLNKDMIYMKDLEKYKNYNGLSEVIYEFLKGLEKELFLVEDSHRGGIYYRWFSRLTEKEQLRRLSRKGKSVGEISLKEEFSKKTLKENGLKKNKYIKQKKKKKTKKITLNEMNNLVKISTFPFAYCVECGLYTSYWRWFEYPEKCLCYCTFEEEKKQIIQNSESNLDQTKKEY